MKTLFTGIVYGYSEDENLLEVWISDTESYYVQVDEFIMVQKHDYLNFHIVTVFGENVSDDVLETY